MWLFFLFLFVPLIEIALFIQVGGMDRVVADARHRRRNGQLREPCSSVPGE
jgi:hypothetical protein